MGTNNTKLSGTPCSPPTNERVHAELSNLESLLDPHFSTQGLPGPMLGGAPPSAPKRHTYGIRMRLAVSAAPRTHVAGRAAPVQAKSRRQIAQHGRERVPYAVRTQGHAMPCATCDLKPLASGRRRALPAVRGAEAAPAPIETSGPTLGLLPKHVASSFKCRRAAAGNPAAPCRRSRARRPSRRS